MKEIYTKFPDLLDAKKEKNMRKKKKKKSYKTIFMWFGNLPMSTELQRFHYFKGKIQDVAVQFYLSKQHKTLISPKQQFFL